MFSLTESTVDDTPTRDNTHARTLLKHGRGMCWMCAMDLVWGRRVVQRGGDTRESEKCGGIEKKIRFQNAA